MLHRLLVLPVALSLAVALVGPTTALAAGSTSKEGLSGYKQTPTTGTSPSKEEKSTPTQTTAPSTTSSVPTTSTSPTESTKSTKSTLPFTGVDLRWTVGIGLLLIAAGFSIVTVQRRQRRDTGR